jgi:hypothetical protein
MKNEQIFVKCNENQKELLIRELIEKEYKIMEMTKNFPIVIDNFKKIVYSAGTPSICACYLTCGGKIYSFKQYLKLRRNYE